MKRIFTREQAASILEQVDKHVSEVDIFTPISKKNKYIKLTNEELEEKLKNRVIDEDSFAGVVDF